MLRISDLIVKPAFPFFANAIKEGSLRIVKGDDVLLRAGDGGSPHFTMNIDSPFTLLRIYSDPDMMLGETFVEGKWNLTQGDLGSFLSWICNNCPEIVKNLPAPDAKHNNPETSKKNVALHYDLGNDLYKTFLDEGMNYSCAFFDDYRMSLRDAQRNKIYTTFSRADIGPGMKVLDIGCGWGELARVIAKAVPDVKVRGITLAENQIVYAQAKNEELEPGERPEFLLTDYRTHARENPGAYDRIVSVGMFEHVGKACYDEFFVALYSMLKPGGKILIHSIMRPEPGVGTTRWMDAHIFPGGSIPYMPDALAAAARHGLHATRVPYIHESTNYAETLRRWRANFNENFDQLDPAKYDEEFKRLWNFYLASSEAAFDGLGFYVTQMVLEKRAS